MKNKIVLILILHFLNGINISHSKVTNCTYINDQSDSVEINCTSDYSITYAVPFVMRLKNYFPRLESEYIDDTSIQESVCCDDLFKSESNEKNRLNVKLLKLSSGACEINSFSEQFQNVQELDASSNLRLNFGIVRYFKNIIKINASHNAIKTLNLLNFNNVPNLYEIDLSYNEIQIIFGVIGQLNTKLSVLNMSHNQMNVLLKNEFEGLTKLKVLDLSYNKITQIALIAFKSNINLEVLRLDNNPLKACDCHMFSPMKNLASVTVTLEKVEILILSCVDCYVHPASENTSEILIRLSGVENELRYKKENFKKLTHFYMNQNEIKNISEIIELLPSSLQLLSLDAKNFTDINIDIFDRFNKLEHFILPYSNLTDMDPKMFLHKSELIGLDLSYSNLIIRNPTALFAPLKKLQIFFFASVHIDNLLEVLQAIPSTIINLNLSFNYLGKLNVTTFQRFNNLQFLYLRHTNLSNFGFNTFYHQTKLQLLDLSYNNLMKIDFILFVSSFQNLDALFLEGNNLSDITMMNRKIFPKLSKLAISKNQLSCHNLAIFLHQWEGLTLIGNPSNQTHMNGTDCYLDVVDPNTTGETTKTIEIASGTHLLTHKHEIIVTHSESHVTKYSILLLCMMCCGYLMVKSKLIARIKEKLANNSIPGNITCRQATSSLALMEQDNL